MILLGTIGHTNFGDYLMLELANARVYDAICGLRNNICT
ncbi:hypothetical protein P23_3619 [Acinetobacter calcoaceticus]|nr:hypothetical protein P23_3619 [Acinetobacter calcoaceticus]